MQAPGCILGRSPDGMAQLPSQSPPRSWKPKAPWGSLHQAFQKVLLWPLLGQGPVNSQSLSPPGEQDIVPHPLTHVGPQCCDSIKGVSSTSHPLALYTMTDQEVNLELGHIRESRNYFYYGFRGSAGLEPRVSVSSSMQVATVLASLCRFPATFGACANLPAWPLRCCDWAAWSSPGAGGPAHTRWEAQDRGSCWPSGLSQGLD